MAAEAQTQQPGGAAVETREIDGKHYTFIDREAFDALRSADNLLEWAEVHGNFYGTPRRPVEKVLGAGRDMIFDIDYQGTRQARVASLDGYRDLLARLRGFHATLEPEIAGALGDDAFLDPRRRIEALDADLACLGLTPAAVEALPRPQSLGLAGPDELADLPAWIETLG